MLQKIKQYIIPVAVPLAVGGLSAFLTRGNMNIYSEIRTPPLSPPTWLFPVVWTVLYVLMGISSAMIYAKIKDTPEQARDALILYAASLAANFAWSIVFFNMRSFLLSFVILLLLLYLIARTISSYRKMSRSAANLQLPYFLWVVFAGYLNAGIFLLNR